ncbi:MAG: MerR family transcriptional regulator [Bacteroidales bacterium]|nr:MerR family transcriptional regulator [Bacteroidales bacterium]
MEEDIERSYFSIGDTSKMFDLTPATLRYWEKEFSEIKPFKNKKGERYYSRQDIDLIKTIHYLTKTKGYTLKGAKEAMKNNFMKETYNAHIASTLLKIKDLLLEIKEGL